MTFESRDSLGNLVVYVIVGVIAIGVMNLFDLPASISAFLYVVLGLLALMVVAALVDGVMNRLREWNAARKRGRLAPGKSRELPHGEAEDGHAGHDVDRTHKAGAHAPAQPSGAGGEDHPPERRA
jgi:flagellar biosynthesis/type III secretory pathway M-ring protein FliF/YscJ